MVNYKNGKIYKIECPKSGLIYIGSTANILSSRVSHHRSWFLHQYKPNKKNRKPCSSIMIFEHTLYPLYETIEYFECKSKFELQTRERFYINKYKEEYGDKVVNKNIPSLINTEIYDNVKDYKKQYFKTKEGFRRKLYEYGTDEKNKAERKRKGEYCKSWGGDLRSDNNNLLKISMDWNK
jgi:hypothetical protein